MLDTRILVISVFMLMFLSLNSYSQKPEDINGWNGSNWGMSLIELQKVFNGRLQKIEDPKPSMNSYPVCEYKITEYSLLKPSDETVQIRFCTNGKTNKFGKVEISRNKKNTKYEDSRNREYTKKVQDGLVRKYGEPDAIVTKSDSRVVKWVVSYWYFPSSTISFSVINGSFALSYYDEVYQDSL